MNVLVTGGTGFIGTELVGQLRSKGYAVRCLVRPGSDTRALLASGAALAKGDVTDPDSLTAALDGIDVVIHLALASQVPDVAVQEQVTVQGTRNLLEACRQRNVARFLFASTIAVTAEKKSTYARTKLEAEDLVKASGLKVTILRPNLVYGPGTRGLFQRIARQIQKLPVVPVIGAGTARLQPVHVSDVAWAFIRCMEQDVAIGKSYDIAGPDCIPFQELLQKMQEAMGVRRPLLHIPVPVLVAAGRAAALLMKKPPFSEESVLGLIQEKRCDISLAVKELGYAPVSLREGLLDAFGKQALGRRASVETGAPARRVGLVGLGKMGTSHGLILNASREAHLVAVADMNPGLEAFAKGLGLRAPFYADVEKMLDEARPEAVHICTPPFTHYALAEACVRRGISIFVEKPLAESLEGARRIYELVRDSRITHACGYTYAYNPLCTKAHALLRAAVLGDVYRFRASMYFSKVLSARDADKGWQSDPAKAGGGVLANVSSHLLGLLHWYFGEVRRVHAWTQQPFSQNVEDTASAVLEFQSGVVGHFDSSWSVAGYERTGAELVVEGKTGTLWMDTETVRLNLTQPQPGFAAGWHVLHAADLDHAAEVDFFGEAFHAEDADFLRCVGSGETPRVTCYEGLKVQELIEAIYESAKRGQPVDVG